MLNGTVTSDGRPGSPEFVRIRGLFGLVTIPAADFWLVKS